ncbi:MAG: dihydropteroate synthase [bacterium]|nr:dihydropteroate synthase [bacterium]
MILIGESINIMSKTIGPAIKDRDPKPVQEMALAQVEGGADMLDLNLGPARKAGDEMMAWLVNTVQEVTDLPLSLDTTNPVAMEAGLKLVKQKALINSASAQPERIEVMLPLAKKYDANVICLLLSNEGIPRTVDERATVAMDILMPAAELGLANEALWIDPLILPASADQQQVAEAIEFMGILPGLADPPVKSTCGLSNSSNGSPEKLRTVINQALYIIMADLGMTSAIVNTLEKEFMAVVRGMDEAGNDKEKYLASLSDEKRTQMEKTFKILRNEVIYSHSWLEL